MTALLPHELISRIAEAERKRRPPRLAIAARLEKHAEDAQSPDEVEDRCRRALELVTGKAVPLMSLATVQNELARLVRMGGMS